MSRYKVQARARGIQRQWQSLHAPRPRCPRPSGQHFAERAMTFQRRLAREWHCQLHALCPQFHPKYFSCQSWNEEIRQRTVGMNLILSSKSSPSLSWTRQIYKVVAMCCNHTCIYMNAKSLLGAASESNGTFVPGYWMQQGAMKQWNTFHQVKKHPKTYFAIVHPGTSFAIGDLLFRYDRFRHDLVQRWRKNLWLPW